MQRPRAASSFRARTIASRRPPESDRLSSGVRGLWLQDGRRRLRDDLPNPSLQPGEALVRVAVAGICGTDLELARGYYPFAGGPGHEVVGPVEMAPAPESRGGRSGGGRP